MHTCRHARSDYQLYIVLTLSPSILFFFLSFLSTRQKHLKRTVFSSQGRLLLLFSPTKLFTISETLSLFSCVKIVGWQIIEVSKFRVKCLVRFAFAFSDNLQQPTYEIRFRFLAGVPCDFCQRHSGLKQSLGSYGIVGSGPESCNNSPVSPYWWSYCSYLFQSCPTHDVFLLACRRVSAP